MALMVAPTLLLLLPTILILLLLIRRVTTTKSTNPNFPPGPPPLPLLGNIHQIPPSKPFFVFKEWAQTYGASSDGLVGLRVGPSARILILSKWHHVRDLLDQRGAIYSGRPKMPIMDYVVPPPSDMHFILISYGAQWRRLQRPISRFLRDDAIDEMIPTQDAESTQLIRDLLAGGGDRYHEHIMRMNSGVLMDTLYGQRTPTWGPESHRFFEIEELWSALLNPGGAPPLDIMPWLKYVPDVLTPWPGWRAQAEDLKRSQHRLYTSYLEVTRRRLEEGKAQDCFAAQLLSGQHEAKAAGIDKLLFTEDELIYICGILFEAGAETTVVALDVFLMAMAAFPDIQKEVQKEVDAQYGDKRMPRLAEARELPFLKACLLEVLRWRPPAPTVIPHAASEDGTYKGYFIPKGTTIIMNSWAIQHDPDEYQDPETFNPSRFLNNEFGVLEGKDTTGRKQSYAFGAGRRLCPGKRMAENSVLMAMAKIIWAFDVVSPGGPPDTDAKRAFKDGVVVGPHEFPLKFVLRNEAKRESIQHEWDEADRFLSRYE